MAWALLRGKFWHLVLPGVLLAVSPSSAVCLEGSFTLGVAYDRAITRVGEEGATYSAAKLRETAQSLRALIKSIAVAIGKTEERLHSATRPSQDVVKQYEQLTLQKKEFENQLKEVCSLLPLLDPTRTQDSCIAGESK
jgi:hypothetical protein